MEGPGFGLSYVDHVVDMQNLGTRTISGAAEARLVRVSAEYRLDLERCATTIIG